MGPPREHGGMLFEAVADLAKLPASMGPPREHGGMVTALVTAVSAYFLLQWGRRVNTAEWSLAPGWFSAVPRLQWGRRVNTAECLTIEGFTPSAMPSFNGAAA